MITKKQFEDNLRDILNSFLFEKMSATSASKVRIKIEDYFNDVACTRHHGIEVCVSWSDYNRAIDVDFKRNGRRVKQSTVLYDHLMSCHSRRHHLSYDEINSLYKNMLKGF